MRKVAPSTESVPCTLARNVTGDWQHEDAAKRSLKRAERPGSGRAAAGLTTREASCWAEGKEHADQVFESMVGGNLEFQEVPNGERLAALCCWKQLGLEGLSTV